MSAPREILISTTPFSGHTAPLLPIAGELVAHGHAVRWLAGRAFEAVVTGTGAQFHALPAAIDYSTASIGELFPDREHLGGLAKLRFDIQSAFIDPVPEQAASLRRLHQERPADLVLSDSVFGGANSFSASDGVRWVSVGVSPLTSPSPYVAPYGLGWQPGRGALARVRNRAMDALMARVLLRPVHERLRALRRELGLPETGGLDSMSPGLHLQSGVRSFEHPRPDLPGQVHFVGALVDHPRDAELPEWWPDVLASPKPVVHVTQGTVANSDLSELVAPTVAGLAGLDVLTVASTGSAASLDPGELPPNARTARFLPHDLLLPHVAVMVTNGGFGGVQKALVNGVPLVVAGSSEDKPEVAARVARSGAGISLRTARPSREAVLAAVKQVLAEPRYRTAAQRLAREYQAVDPPALSADLIETLLDSAAEPVPGALRPKP